MIASKLARRIRERRASYDAPTATLVRAHGLVPVAPWRQPDADDAAEVRDAVTGAQRACEAMVARAAGRESGAPHPWQAAEARLGAALAALPALEAAAATGGRRDLAAALQPLVDALRGRSGG